MPKPRAEALAATAAWKLARSSDPTRGRPGDRLGRGTGSSLEFQDRRDYSVGDDVRRLDWRAFARTDKPLVRLYREELEPRVEILVDASRSMAVEPEKAQLTVDLALFLLRLAERAGAALSALVLADRPERLVPDELEAHGLDFHGRLALVESSKRAQGLLGPRRGALVCLISDFLSPFEAAELVRPLGARAGRLALLQVLAPGDVDPPVGAALRLEDAETGATRELVLDASTVAAYRERLARHGEALATECRRARGELVTLQASPLDATSPPADSGAVPGAGGAFDDHLRTLASAGWIEPA